MALDITGYNATFDAFVKFAETQQAAGKQKAVARFETADAKGLGGIVNRTIKPASGDWVGIGEGRLPSLKRANNLTRDAFRKAVIEMFGSERNIPESVAEAMKLKDYGKGRPLTARRILAVKTAIENSGYFEAKTLQDINVSGNGAMEIGRKLLPGSGLTGIENPGRELKKRMDNVATAAMQIYAVKSIMGMRTEAKGGDLDLDRYASTFEADSKRHLPVSIGEGQPLYTLDLEKARDSYVEFITDGKVKTYADADRKTKIKTCLLMALSSQGFLNSGMTGVSNAFDPACNKSRLQGGEVLTLGKGARKDSLNLSKDEKGNFVFKASSVYEPASLFITDDRGSTGFYSAGEGGSLACGFDVVITDESLEKFADAEWPNVDIEESRKTADDLTIPHSIETAAEKLPGDVKLDMKIDVSFSIKADSLTEVM